MYEKRSVYISNVLREYKIIDRNRLPTVSNLTLVYFVVQVNERTNERTSLFVQIVITRLDVYTYTSRFTLLVSISKNFSSPFFFSFLEHSCFKYTNARRLDGEHQRKNNAFFFFFSFFSTNHYHRHSITNLSSFFPFIHRCTFLSNPTFCYYSPLSFSLFLLFFSLLDD